MKKFYSKYKKIIWIAAIVLIVATFFIVKSTNAKNNACEYVKVERGDLTRTLSLTARVSNGNIMNVNTTASGVVREVLVKNGDKVRKGQAIARLNLDQESSLAQAKAYAAYTSAQVAYEAASNGLTALEIERDANKNGLTSTQNSQNSLSAAVSNAKSAYNSALSNYERISEGYDNNEINPATQKVYDEYEVAAAKNTFNAAKASLAAAKQNYNQVGDSINLAQKQVDFSQDKINDYTKNMEDARANLNAAGLALSLSNSTLKAPVDGTIKGIKIVEGSSIDNSTASPTGLIVAYVETGANPILTADISETDVPYIKTNQVVEVTIDAFPAKIFTAKVVTINAGTEKISDNADYSVIVQLDERVDEILPNMAATIIFTSDQKKDILIIPTKAIESASGKFFVQKLEDGKPIRIKVEIGDENDTESEVTSGLSEGDLVNPIYGTDKNAVCKNPIE